MHVLGERTATFPVDPVGNGTWVGVNDVGLAAALLNRNRHAPAPNHPRPPHSRGIVVPLILACASLDEALATCSAVDMGSFDPFRLLIVHREEVAVITPSADGIDVEISQFIRPLMLTSSSLGDAMVEVLRQQLFTGFFSTDADAWIGAQRRFHRHQWPQRPDISVLMERSDARTVSHTVVAVNSRHIALTYRSLGSATPAAPVGSGC
jgi:hypothetical protein